MHRVTPDRPWPLHDIAATRRIESRAAAGLPAHTLMQRAGAAVARLAMALAPHARTVWIACGPGNNGGDGLEAAALLSQSDAGGAQARPRRIVVTWLGDEGRLPDDARASLQRARAAGIEFSDEPPGDPDLVIDAILGLGAGRVLEGRAAQWQARMAQACVPVLAVDLPSGLNADTGRGPAVRATHTLSLLTLKPGLFTAQGRDAAGTVWLDNLGVPADLSEEPAAILAAPAPRTSRPHDSHKGSWGDVAVIGGSPGMTGAALLAADAGLHAGAGRVFVGLTGYDGTKAAEALGVDAARPELMFRPVDTLDLAHLHVACGCGGGDAVRRVLAGVLSRSASLVLDADALNAIAADTSLQSLLMARTARMPDRTVLTPHPLEAARLLACTAAEVQADRLAAARALAARFGAVVALKGSGTVICAPGRVPQINPTGNARLASAGTGDVLAGMVAARLANGLPAFDAAISAVHAHGLCADNWLADQSLTASRLARRIG